MDNNDEKLQSEYVMWRYIDIFICVFAFYAGTFFSGYHHYKPISIMSIPLVLVPLIGGKLYLRERAKPMWFKVGSGILRAVCYIVFIVALIFCLMSTWDIKDVYSVQRKLCVTNISEPGVDEFLPESVPEKSDDYRFDMACAPKNGISRVDMSFVTDKDTVEAYRKKAHDMGMSSENEPVEDYYKKWEETLKNVGVDYEKAEFLYASDSSENYPKLYILDDETGYVRIYF